MKTAILYRVIILLLISGVVSGQQYKQLTSGNKPFYSGGKAIRVTPYTAPEEQDDFNYYKQWQFEGESLGEYTEAEVNDDFDVYTFDASYDSNHGDSIVLDEINGSSTKVWKSWNKADALYTGMELIAYIDLDYSGDTLEAEEIYMTYNMRTDPNFNSTHGGKIPGLRGLPPTDGGWVDGESFYYAPIFLWGTMLSDYHYDRTEATGYWPWATSSVTGDNGFLLNDSVWFNNGTWYNVTQRVVRNTFTGGVPNHDGIEEIWVDGRMVFQTDTLVVLQNEDKGIDAMAIVNYYGGDTDTYKPLSDCYFMIDNIAIWMPGDDSISGQELHSPLAVLPTPHEITDRANYYDEAVVGAGAWSTPGYPSEMGSCSNYQVWFHTIPGKVVRYTFSAGMNGGQDYIMFYDGADSDDPLLMQIDGYDEDLSDNGYVESTDQDMFLRISVSEDVSVTKFTGTVSFE